MGRSRNLVLDYGDDLRLFRTRPAQVGAAALLVAYLLVPLQLDDFWLSVLNFAGVFAIGALGLNLLTGFTGQVSLGHAFFLGVGAYAAAWLGDTRGLPFAVWLPVAAVIGGLVGALVGPFALRLKGNYLAIVSLGLVFVGQHVFESWESVTGGAAGRSGLPAATLGPLDFGTGGTADLFGRSYTRDQSYFWLVWAVLALLALVAKNIVRSRPGRAMQAVRDRDLAAEVIGVSLFRTKVGAFVISSAMAAVAGALYGSYKQYVSPEEWGLLLSVQFVAVIIVGGVGTVFGSILGALALGGAPRVVEEFSDRIPFIAQGTESGLTIAQTNQLLFGLLIVFFLVVEPHGLAAVWLRVKRYFRTWPFGS